MIIKIVFWLLLVDSIIANAIAWSNKRDYFNKYRFFKRYVPITKGWTVWYLLLTLFIGYLIYF